MKYLNYSFVLFFFVALTSCNLDETPKDSILPETFFKTSDEMVLYTNQFYKLEPSAEDLYGEASNLIIDGLVQPTILIGLTRVVPASGGGWSWSMLRHINYYFQNSNKCSDATARKENDGLAYFWRAYFYLNKLQMFGPVPWYDEPIASDDEEMLQKPRDSRDVIFNHIIADCDSAYAKLPTTTTVYNVSKYAALALKSRACLFEGTFRKYHAGDVFNPENLPYKEILEQCVETSLLLINSNKYQLYTTGTTPYYSFFTLDNADTSENILARCYSPNFAHLASAYALVASKGRAGYTKALVNSYLMSNGTRFTDKADWQTMSFNDEMKNRDPRLLQTVLGQAGTYADGKAATYKITTTITGYPVKKFVAGSTYSTAAYNDIPIFRIAETYLNYAEAKAELGTLTQNDLDISLNKLRDRVKMPHLDMAAANADPDPFLETKQYGYINVDKGANKGVILEIRRERSIELVGEGLRFWDLCRWREGHLCAEPYFGPYIPGPGKYDMDGDGKIDFVAYTDTKITEKGVTSTKIGTDIQLSNNTSGNIIAFGTVERSFNENRDYLYPIPTNERTLTKGALTQNPGWDDGLNY